MRSWITGRRQPAPEAPELYANPNAPLSAVRVSGAGAPPRDLGRRGSAFEYDRVYIPSLVVDHTEHAMRVAGTCGNERFVVWAGTLAGGDAHVTTMLLPQPSWGPGHAEISSATTAHIFQALDARDLVPILQLHTHPLRAGLSPTDAIRPVVAVAGFLSVVIPNFGFVDLADVACWSAHEYLGASRWRELDPSERRRRLVVDDSIIVVD